MFGFFSKQKRAEAHKAEQEARKKYYEEREERLLEQNIAHSFKMICYYCTVEEASRLFHLIPDKYKAAAGLEATCQIHNVPILRWLHANGFEITVDKIYNTMCYVPVYNPKKRQELYDFIEELNANKKFDEINNFIDQLKNLTNKGN